MNRIIQNLAPATLPHFPSMLQVSKRMKAIHLRTESWNRACVLLTLLTFSLALHAQKQTLSDSTVVVLSEKDLAWTPIGPASGAEQVIMSTDHAAMKRVRSFTLFAAIDGIESENIEFLAELADGQQWDGAYVDSVTFDGNRLRITVTAPFLMNVRPGELVKVSARNSNGNTTFRVIQMDGGIVIIDNINCRDDSRFNDFPTGGIPAPAGTIGIWNVGGTEVGDYDAGDENGWRRAQEGLPAGIYFRRDGLGKVVGNGKNVVVK